MYNKKITLYYNNIGTLLNLLMYIDFVKKKNFIKIKKFLSGRFSLVLFLFLSFLALFFGSTLLLGESYKDIFIVIMIWSLPLFLH